MADVLSQQEIDSLLESLSSGDTDDLLEEEDQEQEGVRSYDFRRPDKLSKEQLRTLRIIHENYGRLLTTTLSTQLRTMVEIDIASIEQLSYDEFIRSLPQPTIMAVCNLSPLDGQFIMEVNPSIGYPIIDRLFGGVGSGKVERTLTDIERVVFRRVFNWLLGAIPESWENVVDLRGSLEDIESNPYFTQIVPGNDTVILITFETKIAQATGLLNICFPFIMLEPIVSKLSAQFWYASSDQEQSKENIESLKRKLEKASFPISVELGHARLTLQDLMRLKKGDVIELDQKLDQELQVRVGRHVKFLGHAGQYKGRMALKVSRRNRGEVEEDGE